MQKTIKVLQLHPDYNVKSNDVSDLAEQIIKGLPSDRFEVTSAYFSGSPRIDQPRSIAKNVHYFNLSDNDMRGMRLKALWKLYRFCSVHRFDVIICNRFKTISLLLQLNKLLKVPVCIGISHVLNEYDRFYRRLQIKLFADSYWKFVGVSEAVASCLISYKCGFNLENTCFIPNAIDISKAESSQLSKEEARSLLGLPQDKLIIGTIGQLFARKGHRYLISALANLQHKFPNAHIGIIGRGEEEENLKTQIAQLGLQDRVHLLGYRENALQYVRAFDIWSMPSMKEGLPLALLEGMSGHLPIIASDIPEMRDIILGAGGLATPPKNIAQLTKALENYLSLSPSNLVAKGEQVYNYLLKNHSIEAYRNAYKELIESQLKVK